MKAIIIEEDRFREILEHLEAEKEKMIDKSDDNIKKFAINDAHRNFHYHLVTWMQSHGASCIR